MAGDPIFSQTVRSKDDGADERLQTKIVGNATDASLGAAAVNQAVVDSSGRLLTATGLEVATAPNGGTLPATTKVISGYDGTNVKVIHTDSAGDVQVDLASSLPAGTNTIGSIKVQDGNGNIVTSTSTGSTRPWDVILRDAAGTIWGTITNLFYVGSIPYQWSEAPNAAAKHGYLLAGTGSRVFTNGTVTAGKTLYVTEITISAYVTGSTAVSVSIRDGAGGADKIPFAVPPGAALGTVPATQPLAAVHIQFREPKSFTTSVAVDVVSGSITYAASFSGIEK